MYGYEDPLSIECYDTYNPNNKLFTDRTVGNAIDRQWQWMLCNEPFGWWQEYVFSLISLFPTPPGYGTQTNTAPAELLRAKRPSSPATSTPPTGSANARSSSPHRKAPPTPRTAALLISSTATRTAGPHASPRVYSTSMASWTRGARLVCRLSSARAVRSRAPRRCRW